MGRDGTPKEPKNLLPRGSAYSANLDVLIAVDGSGSISPDNFRQEKQIILALAARLKENSQLGVLQFGSTSQVVSGLASNIPELEAKVDAMAQIGGGTNLLASLEQAYTEFGLSRRPGNAKQLWIITDGAYEEPTKTTLAAQKLAREKQVTTYAIGVGNGVTLQLLNRVASLQCSYLVKDFESAFKVLKLEGQKDLSVQLSASIVFDSPFPYKLGQDVFLNIEITNNGKKTIPQGSKIVFKANDYFREKFAVIPDNITTLKPEYNFEGVKLVPKIKANRANLDSQMQALPSVLELYVVDNEGNEVFSDCSGFFLNHEDFSGDIYQYTPQYYPEVAHANVITFGPPGAGKSSFVNSVISALGEEIKVLSIAGATRNVVTAGLMQFPLQQIPGFTDLKLALYDVPGLDGKNYKGEELGLMMYGIMPPDVDFKHNAANYSTVRGRRSTAAEEFRRQAHVVAFFVPQGGAGDTDLMNRLSQCLYQITVEHKRKAIVVISHADEVPGEEDRKVIMDDVCQALSIDSSSVFFLENYVDTKVKQFQVDKNVLRILLAMISRADDFLQFNKLNPIVCPFERNPMSPGGSTPTRLYDPEPAPPQEAPSPTKPRQAPIKKEAPVRRPAAKPVKKSFVDELLDKMPEAFQSQLRLKIEEEGLDDEDTIRSMTKDDWQSVGFKFGDIKRIQNALQEMPPK